MVPRPEAAHAQRGAVVSPGRLNACEAAAAHAGFNPCLVASMALAMMHSLVRRGQQDRSHSKFLQPPTYVCCAPDT